MPRKKDATPYQQQVYDLDGATVTIRWAPGRRPKMQHLDTIVIIGDHVCAPLMDAGQVGIDPGFHQVRQPRGGNFEVNENNPDYARFKAGLAGPRKVLTSEQVLRDAGMYIPEGEQLDLGALSMLAAVPSSGEGNE